MIQSRFQNLNFGTKVSTVKQEIVEVQVDPVMFRDYAQSYFREAQRVNPLAMKEMNLTVEELEDYFLTLLNARIQSLRPEGCPMWRTLKLCCIPDFLQFALSTIGIFVDQAYGLKVVPVFNYEGKGNVLDTSAKIEFLMKFGLAAVKDAMPRGIDGDPDVMSLIIINDYVYGRRDDHLPLASYVAAFLGLKLTEETAFKMLYRCRYDDVSFISDMLMHERSILG